MVRRDHLVEAKLIKELPLISVLPPHHRRLSCRQLSRNHCSLGSSSPFFDSIGHGLPECVSARRGYPYSCRLLQLHTRCATPSCPRPGSRISGGPTPQNGR